MNPTWKTPIPHIPYQGMLLLHYCLAVGILQVGPRWEEVRPIGPPLGPDAKEDLRLLMKADAVRPGPEWNRLVAYNPDLSRLGEGDLDTLFTS